MQALRAFRKSHGLTQAEVAAKLKVTQEMVAQIESGARKPSPELSEQISRLMSGSAQGSSPRGPYFGQR